MASISSLPENKSIILFSTIIILIISCHQNETANAKYDSRIPILASKSIVEASKDIRRYYTSYIEIVENCSSNYTEQETKRKCENKATDKDFSEDIFLFKPVTSKKTNITYLNIYCAICNLENNTFSFWDVALSFESNNVSKYVHIVDDRSIFDNLEWNGSSWVSSPFIDGTIYTVRLYRHLPSWLKTVHCGDDSTSKLNQFDANTKLNWDPLKKRTFARTSSKEITRHCVYYDEYGDVCERNGFFIEGFTFTKCDNGEAIGIEYSWYFYNRCKKLDNGVAFDARFWYFHNFRVETKHSGFSIEENWVFVCGKNTPTRPKVWKKVEIYPRYVSMISIVVYLVLAIKSNKSNSFCLSDITLYSYSFAVLLLYVYYQCIQIHLMSDCFSRYFTLLYFICCNVFNVLVFVYESWRTIIGSLRGPELLKNNRLKRYLAYFIVAWILPLIPTSICIFLMENSTPSVTLFECPILSQYTERQVFSSCQDHAIILEENASLIYVLFGLLLIAPTMFFVYVVKFDKLRSTFKKVPLCVLSRAMYLMSFYWMMIVLLYFKYNFDEITNIVGRVFLSFHGVIILLVFGFEMEMVKGMLRKCGFNVTSRVKRTEVDLVQFTQRIVVPLVGGDEDTSQTHSPE